MASYRSTIIHGSTTRQDYLLDILLFIQSILYIFMMLFDDLFVLMVHIVYLISFFVHYTIIISIMCILAPR